MNTDPNVFKLDNNDIEYKDTECPICVTDYNDSKMKKILDCGHTFCDSCLMRVISMNPFCPICLSFIQLNHKEENKNVFSYTNNYKSDSNTYRSSRLPSSPECNVKVISKHVGNNSPKARFICRY